MKQYLKLLRHIRDNGVVKTDRTGTGTLSVFGYQMRFNLAEGFPLVTTKKMFTKGIIHELLWFLRGDTNIQYLLDNGVHIWDEWADENGDLGPVYGAQWRQWESLDTPYNHDGSTYPIYIDQVLQLINDLKNTPDSRRLIVSAWNPGDIDKMALPPCHCLFQFNTEPLTVGERLSHIAFSELHRGYESEEQLIADLDRMGVPKYRLSCQLYQRSADVFLGVPFNIASYALLTMMVAQVSNMVPGDFVHTFGDVHIYSNHMDQVEEQLSREPYPLPRMVLNPEVTDIFDFKYEDFTLQDYQSHAAISAPVAV